MNFKELKMNLNQLEKTCFYIPSSFTNNDRNDSTEYIKWSDVKNLLNEEVIEDEEKQFDENMLEAVKVIFLKPIFEDDFPNRGMKAWLTAVEKDRYSDCWKLYFDFTEFEAENDKYLQANYYNDKSIPCLTAKEVGMYQNKYSVYFGEYPASKSFNDQLKEYLKII